MIRASKTFNRVLRLVLGKYLKLLFNVEFSDDSIGALKPPYVILANHTNFWDPFLISIIIPHPIYFIASDAYFRNFFLRQLLKLVGAIPKMKSISDSSSVKSIFKVKNADGIIGIFPEGNRNWDGKTLKLLFPTAKLIKGLTVPVVTALLKGAHLSMPRWSKKARRGNLVILYRVLLQPEEIHELTVDEIYNIISEGLTYDEYTEQKQRMMPYKGKRLAENLELFLFTCPHCKAIGSLSSDISSLSCSSCNYSVVYDEFGFFKTDFGNLYFNNPSDWDKWQCDLLEQRIHEYRNGSQSAPLFEDFDVQTKKGNRKLPLNNFRDGRISLYVDRLLFTTVQNGTLVFYIDKINGMNVQYNDTFEFYYDKDLYRFEFKHRKISAYKWVKAVQMIKDSKIAVAANRHN